MPTRVSTRWKFDNDMQKFKARHNRSRILENMVMVFTRKQDQNPKLRAFSQLEKKKKIDCFNVDGYCDHCKTVFEAMVVTTSSVPVEKLVLPY